MEWDDNKYGRCYNNPKKGRPENFQYVHSFKYGKGIVKAAGCWNGSKGEGCDVNVQFEDIEKYLRYDGITGFSLETNEDLDERIYNEEEWVLAIDKVLQDGFEESYGNFIL